MHGRREDVVRRLAHVDVVVRVHVLARERRDHLVGVHVRRGAGAGLEDVDRELVVELAGRDPVAGGGDPLRLLRVEQPELGVDARRRGLDPPEPARDRRRDRLAGDREVVDRLRGLAAPELLGARRSGLMRSSRSLGAQTSAPTASSSSQRARASRAGGRAARRAARSCSSIACQPAYSTNVDAALGEQRARARRSAACEQPGARRPRAAARRSRSRPSCSCRSRRSGRA